MKAVALKKFTASINGHELACDAGGELECDAKTIKQLEAIGLVTTKTKPKRKAADND